MKEKPILFSTPMVQALLNTKPNTWPVEPVDPSKPYKSMTRRVVKQQPREIGKGERLIIEAGKLKKVWRGFGELWETEVIRNVPYSVGDILWVRESFQAFKRTKIGDIEPRVYNGEDGFYTIGEFDYVYKADDDNPENRWCPSIFMPRVAARLFLEVKKVRIERVKDIDIEDVMYEGVTLPTVPAIHFTEKPDCFDRWSKARQEEWIGDLARHTYIADLDYKEKCITLFKSLWDHLNAKRGYPWDSNPWVWVYEFMRTDKC
jgi:hypothetical protein